MEIKGKGIREYRIAFDSGRIKPNDDLFIQNNSLEHYIVIERGRLDWENVFNKNKAEQLTISQILSRRRWYVKPK